jgi:hypothetical protein
LFNCIEKCINKKYIYVLLGGHMVQESPFGSAVLGVLLYLQWKNKNIGCGVGGQGIKTFFRRTFSPGMMC